MENMTNDIGDKAGRPRNPESQFADAADGIKETRKETVLKCADERDEEGNNITTGVALSKRSRMALFF